MADDELTGLMSLTPDVLNSFCMLFCLVIREERPPLTLNSLVLDQTSTSRSVWHHYDVTGVAEHFLSIRRHIQSNVQKRVALLGGGRTPRCQRVVSSPVVLSAQMEHARADCVFTRNHISFLRTPSLLRTVKSAWLKQRKMYRKLLCTFQN